VARGTGGLEKAPITLAGLIIVVLILMIILMRELMIRIMIILMIM